MNLDDRLTQSMRDIADGVVPPEVDIHAVRTAARGARARWFMMAAAAALVLAIVAVTAVLGGRDTAAQLPPAGPPSVVDTIRGVQPDGTVIVDAAPSRPGDWEPSQVQGLPAAGSAPYPPWKALDQDAGRFLFTSDGVSADAEVFTVRVVEAGRDTPLATIRCRTQCNWVSSFGPKPDEVTVRVERKAGEGEPTGVEVYGLDGSRHQAIDLAPLLQADTSRGGIAHLGFGINDIEWSPDGRHLAVSTFTGGREPSCTGSPCEARLWVVGATGGDPVLVHTEALSAKGAQPDSINPPVLDALAWSPDGTRIAGIATTYYPWQASPPTLLVFDAETGQRATVHQFTTCEDCGPSDPDSGRPAFAWSPDGQRFVVRDAQGIEQLASDGTVLASAVGGGAGPLAWLTRPPG